MSAHPDAPLSVDTPVDIRASVFELCSPRTGMVRGARTRAHRPAEGHLDKRRS
jgi:hypothetical protein